MQNTKPIHVSCQIESVRLTIMSMKWNYELLDDNWEHILSYVLFPFPIEHSAHIITSSICFLTELYSLRRFIFLDFSMCTWELMSCLLANHSFSFFYCYLYPIISFHSILEILGKFRFEMLNPSPTVQMNGWNLLLRA